MAALFLIGSSAPLTVRANASLTGFSVSQTPPAPASEPAPPARTASAAPATSDLPAHDATVGTMAGQAGTSGGAATYSVPVVVPPGRAGMQPSLSLNYNSRSGNGVMGVGWSIGGLSSIHRCPQTPEQDGQTLGVTYGASDRLCLDGQRLVSVSGTYGTSGAIYRTEVDSYARVVQVGGGLTGTATCFRVDQHDGRILHYGDIVKGGTSTTGLTCAGVSTTSRVNPTGASATSSWLIQSIQDRVGNNQIYSYTDYGNGEVLLSSISYTGYTNSSFTTTAGDRTVNLAYQTRSSAASGATDVSSSYLAGGLTMQTQALQSITTKVGTSTVRTYTPTYYASQYNGRLLMTAMQECATGGGTTACHPKTQFAFNDNAINTSGNFPIESLQGFGFNASTSYTNVPFEFTILGDLDGDGSKEVGVTVHETGGQKFYLAQMTADRQIHTGVDISTLGYGTLPGLSGDIDGSGRTAMVKLPTSGTANMVFGIWNLNRGAIATTNPFTPISSNVPFDGSLARYGQNQNVLAADMDGDGKTDLLVVEADASCGSDVLGTQLALFLYRNTTSGQLSAGGSASFTKQTSHLICLNRVGATSVGSAWYAPTIDHIADFDGDGLPDIYMVYSGYNYTTIGSFAGILQTSVSAGVVSVTQKSPSTVLTCDSLSRTSATDECNWQNGYFAHWIDVNGDGLEDFVIARPYQSVWQVRLNKGGTLAPAVTATAPSYAGLSSYQTNSADGSGWAFAYLNRLPTMDVDGDGKPDILIPQASMNNTAQDVHGFALKMCVAQVQSVTTTESCPQGEPTSAPVTPSAPEGPLAVHQCVVYFCPVDPGTGALNLPDNVFHANVPPEGPPKEWNNLPAYPEFSPGPGGGTTPNTADLSVYHLAALKFSQSSTGAFTVSVVNTPLVSRLNDRYGNSSDLFGDGLADLTTAVGCDGTTVTGEGGTYPHCAVVDTYGGTTYGPTTFPDTQNTPTSTFANTWALYGNINQGVTALGGTPFTASTNALQPAIKAKATNATSLGLSTPILPGLMDASVNGVGDVASWGYLPLSTPRDPALYGFPLYSVPSTGGYADARHYYFQSSMPVVSGMLQSPAVGSDYGGSRSAVYGYSQAMYNHMGRGFTGFYQITTKEYVPPSAPTALQARANTTLSTYNQKFPLISKVASIQRYDATSGITYELESDNYICTLSNRTACPDDTAAAIPPSPTTGGTVFTPMLDTQTVKSYDLTGGTQYAQVDTVNASTSNSAVSGWDAFGNLGGQTITRADKGTNLFVTSHTTATTNQFDTTDTINWWVNKLTSSSMTVSVAYNATNHALPSGASAPSRTLVTNYTYDTDRTLASKTVVPTSTANEDVATAYTYPSPSYGLPTQVQVCLGDYNTSSQCVAQVATALSPLRTTKFAYTKDGATAASDGYFVLNTTDPNNNVTKTTHETNDGQVLTTTDPNSVQTVTTYDPFGRVTELDHLDNTVNHTAIESAIQSAYTSCLNTSTVPPSPGNCPSTTVGEDYDTGDKAAYEGNAAYRVTTVQTGYPTQVTWYDLLGRKIKTAHAGFDGTFIGTLAAYDDLGTASAQSTPYFISTSTYAGTTPYLTTFAYDTQNRPTQKIAPGSEIDPTHGDVQTDYIYSGRKTTTTVHGTSITLAAGNTCPSSAGNLCLQTNRIANALGELMQTTESPILNGTATAHTTNYWTEPLGHVAAITDAEGNLTKASYNALGQRTQSSDPDQGVWNFTYDALGELLTQTDARSLVTTVNSRDALGRTTEQQQVPPVTVPTGMANEIVLDDWTFDPANGIGELGTATRKRGSNRTTPSSNPQVWQESYGYENATARLSTITTTINEAGSVALSSAMSYDANGRPDTHTYPGGLIVKNGYTTYGQLSSIGKSGGTTYWTATTANEWDHVTGETYTGGAIGTHVDYHSTGAAYSLSWSGGGANDHFVYGYDSFSNLTSQARTGSSSNTERYTYDPLQRLTQAARTGGTVNYGYSKSGNLTKKDDFSTTATNAYSYAATNLTMNGCGPHAANSVALPSGLVTNYNCDANGNVIGGNTLTATFDADNHPRTTTRIFVAGSSDTIFCNGFDSITTCGKPGTTTGAATWAYASTGQRYYELSNGTNRYFGPAGYEQASGVNKMELGPVIVSRTGTTDTITVALRDRLGSTLDAIDGSTASQRHFDAFGAARNGDMSSRRNGTLNLTPDTIHGFTSHTHEDDVAIVHMNGRVFDPILGRFLSVDPIAHVGSQGLNPYSYLHNSPFGGTDPTGYTECTTGSHNAPRDCADMGVKYNHGGGPSVSEKNSAVAASLSSQADRVATDNGGVTQSDKGPGGAKNLGARAEDQMTLTNAPTTLGGQAPTLGTISVTAPSYGRVLLDSIQAHLSLLNPWNDDFFYDGFSPVNPQAPTRRERLEAQLAQQAAQHPTAAAAGSAIVTLGTIVVAPEEAGELEAGALIEDVSSIRGSTASAVSQIDRAAFRSERSSFWKTEASSNPQTYTAENLARMKAGKAPIGADGHPMELHHMNGTQNGGLQPMTRTQHRIGENYINNHPWLRGDNSGGQ